MPLKIKLKLTTMVGHRQKQIEFSFGGTLNN